MFLNFAGKSENLSPRSQKKSQVFLTFTLLLFDNRVGHPLKKENERNLKKNHNSNSEKSNFKVNNFQDLFLKISRKIISIY